MKIKIIKASLAISGVALLAACGSGSKSSAPVTVYQNGYIYTSDLAKSVAQAVAIKDGEIIYVGSNEGVTQLIDSKTTVVDLESKMMLPGLHDVHIHPTAIVDLDVCDIGMEELDLTGLAMTLTACQATYNYPEGEKFMALQWNSYTGNAPTSEFSTLLEALDSVSTVNPIYLLGPDGHTAAVNSYALDQVKNEAGETVGLNKTTLATDFSDYVPFVSVDGDGNPTGKVTEAATHLAGVPGLSDPLKENPEELKKIPEKLNKYGITSVQDAWAEPSTVDLYKTLSDAGDMTFRVTAAQAVAIDDHVANGSVDYTAIVAELVAIKNSLNAYPYVKANSVKIMLDGVQEANILEVPPTLPTSFMLENFKQPIFDLSDLDNGNVGISGYVDTNSSACQEVRNTPSSVDTAQEVSDFTTNHGHHPGQCAEQKGELLAAAGYTSLLAENNVNTITFLNTFVSQLDKADLTVHMHSVGDGSTRAAIDAIEYAKQQNTVSELPHTIAHMQVVHPDDQTRLGDLGIYLAFTYSWAVPSYEYDLSVSPFLDELADATPANLYADDNYGMQSVYPVKTAKDAGGILVAGSDAPVDTREPVPFVHMATGMTRADLIQGEPVVLNADQVVSVHDMIAAYTINGAKALRQDDIVGSIEVGKRADLIVIDRNIVELAENEDSDAVYDIFDTQVLTTIFDGKVVYNVAAE